MWNTNEFLIKAMHSLALQNSQKTNFQSHSYTFNYFWFTWCVYRDAYSMMWLDYCQPI